MFHRELKERITDIDEVKQIEVKILDAFVSFCNQNNLRYYLAYGTLLGAVRHKGFIPWDDDIDVTMPRPDYQKFISLWPAGGKYAVLECTQNEEYVYPFAKVCDTDTFLQERGVCLDYDMGIYIDVFPLDAIPGTLEDSKGFIRSLQNQEKCRLYSMMPCEYIFKDGSKTNFTRKLLWRVIKAIGPHRFAKRMNRRSQKYGYSPQLYGGSLTTRFPEHEIFPLSILEETTELEFEGKRYIAPADYNQVLTLLYGDYMELPPEEERVLKHDFKAWKCC